MEKTLYDYIWVILSAGLVFLMQAGFAMLETGFTRSKNSINVAIKNLTDVGISSVAFWLLGFGLMFGNSFKGIIGINHFLFSPGKTDWGIAWDTTFFLFQLMFAATCATIVSGAVAERMRFTAYLVISAFISAIIYPIFGHWAWGGALLPNSPGWLGSLGFVDFAGSTVVHSMGGWVALAAVLIIGPRKGRFDNSIKMQGSNIPISVLGTLLLWLGWFGFNGGSTLEMNTQVPGIVLRTSLAGATGMLAALFLGWIIYKKADISLVINGSLAGLVAITANAHAVTEAESLLIGAIGGLIMLATQEVLEKLKIDDVVGAIPVHLASGIWGTLAVGIFGKTDILGTGLSRIAQIGIQLLGITVAAAWGFFIPYIFLKTYNKISAIRVSEEIEDMGLNVGEHGASTELYDFFKTLDKQAATGDLSLRVPEEPFTEIGQIAKAYNKVISHLENTTIDRNKYMMILENIKSGLFMISKDYKIDSHYSANFLKIFNITEEDVNNNDFINIIKPMVSKKTLDSIKDYIDLFFTEHVEELVLKEFNPFKELDINISTEKNIEHKILTGSAKRVYKDEKIDAVMIIVEDVTEEALLERELKEQEEKTRSEMEIFYKLIHIDPHILEQFAASVAEDIETVTEIAQKFSDTPKEGLNHMFRYIHSIKGDAYAVGLDNIGDAAHKIEENIQEIRAEGKVRIDDLINIVVLTGEIKRTLKTIETLKNKLLSFKESYNNSEADPIYFSIEKLLTRIETEQGVKINLDMGGYKKEEIPVEHYKKIKDIIIQCIRNAISHAIEEPEERIAQGKPPHPTITVATSKTDKEISISIKDDGRGINYEKIAEKAKTNGYVTTKNRKDLIRLLFTEGISSKDKVDIHAGRGVGLPLVGNIIRQLGGRIKVYSMEGKGTEFIFYIPFENNKKTAGQAKLIASA
ncbi:ammonium transporter [Spirochaetia bacterium 38H-sp]|uniref:histidine kinase n=1 Tax=Rarispira pelagica TaxID=3141764 RepID=A0ABU9UCJ9_9SPIR